MINHSGGSPMSACDRFEEQLPLLGYPDELSAAERAEVLTHVAGCAECRALKQQLESAAAELDLAPLERPDPARWAGLKERVLAEVGAVPASEGCPQEADLLVKDTLDAAGLAALDAHVAGCATCSAAAREFGLVGRALDLWKAPPVPASMKDEVLARVSAVAPAPAGRLVSFRAFASAAGMAAAVLLGLWIGLAPVDAQAAIARADLLVLEGEHDLARREYERLLSRPQVAGRAAEVLAALEGLDQSWDAGDPKPRIVVDNPVNPVAAIIATKNSLILPITSATHPASIPLSGLVMSPKVRAAIDTDPTLRLRIPFTKAVQAEERGDVIEARRLYQEVIDLDPASPEGLRAAERMKKLPA